MSRFDSARSLRRHPGAALALAGSVMAVSSFAFATPAHAAASVSSDDSRASAVTGNIHSCPAGQTLVTGGTSTTTQNGITVTVTSLGSPQSNPFPANGWTTLPKGTQVLNVTLPSGASLIGHIYVKGGSGYNPYPGSDLSGLIPPVNHGGNIAGLSHFLICGTLMQPTVTPTLPVSPTPTVTQTISIPPSPDCTTTTPPVILKAKKPATAVQTDCPTPTPTTTETVCPSSSPTLIREEAKPDAVVTVTACPTPTTTETVCPSSSPTGLPGIRPDAVVTVTDCPTPTQTATVCPSTNPPVFEARPDAQVTVTDCPTPTQSQSTTPPPPPPTSTTPTPPPTQTSSSPPPPPPSGDLKVHKTVNKKKANYGDNLTYTLDVSASGQSPEDDVVVTDSIPAHTSYVSAGCDSPCFATGPAAGVITWHVGDMAAGTSVDLTLVVKIDMPATETASAETIRNSAVASSDEDPNVPSNTVKTHVNHVLGEQITRHHHHAPPQVQPSGSTLPFTGLPTSTVGKFALMLIALGLILEILGRLRSLDAAPVRHRRQH